MARVLTFVPCERIVQEQGTNNVSIFSIMEELHMAFPVGIPSPPKGIFAPIPWAIFGLLLAEDGDDGKSFDVQARLIGPSGDVLFETSRATIPAFKSRHHHQWINQGFPIWESGPCELEMMLKESTQQQFDKVASFPIQIVHENDPSLPQVAIP